ncbi:hypothetical protein ATO10_05876 [Actibacterium atlanticum]|uniref:Uncharacterized protein n=1 Tax=Actibacterium atlanticum TaxID=1461693 RepID=A0A058ZNP3_9RHOB|nr:hypothetical protein [Actibacterium atlanticum]KCV82446.1 hypothetical protein ATO10_05876 [Actibacterium atlanticum]
MAEQMRSYATARTLFSIAEMAGWIVVGLSFLIGLTLAGTAGRYASGTERFLLFLAGASGSVVGILIVAAVQNWRAGVDTAEYTQQMLKIARDQLDVSRQSLKSNAPPQSFFDAQADQTPAAPPTRSSFASAPAPAKPEPSLAIESSSPSPDKIEQIDGKYTYNGIPFDSLEKAERYVEQFGRRPLPGVTRPG